MTDLLEGAILQLVDEAKGRSVAPEAVARAVGGEEWRSALPRVRAVAKAMARNGRLLILRHGKPVDPEGLKGVYRLAAVDGG